jgi:replicative DNA helicase
MTKKELIISFNEILKRAIIASKGKDDTQELTSQQIKAEESILGALLLEGDDSKYLFRFLYSRDCFSFEIRRCLIFKHMESLFNESAAISVSAVNELLEQHGLLNNIGVDYLEELRNNALSTRQIKFLVRELDNVIIYYQP